MFSHTYVKNLLFISVFAIVLLIVFYYQTQPLKSSFVQVVETHQKRYVFFDLGVNNGDSLMRFFEMKQDGS